MSEERTTFSEESARCPYCGQQMPRVHYAITGAVRFCYSREAMAFWISRWRPDVEVSEALESNEDQRLHTIAGPSGIMRGRWPKEGFYCSNCGTMTVNVKEHI